MKRAKYLLFLACVAAGLCGCIRDIKEGASPGIHVDDDLVKMRMNSVAVLDRELQVVSVTENLITGSKEYGHASKIAVESSGGQPTVTGSVEVWAILRNRTNHPLQLECNTQFFNRNGAPVEGPTAWQRVMLSPNAVSTYREFSTAAASDGLSYYIQVREGR